MFKNATGLNNKGTHAMTMERSIILSGHLPPLDPPPELGHTSEDTSMTEGVQRMKLVKFTHAKPDGPHEDMDLA
jgi:hypothetical protein